MESRSQQRLPRTALTTLLETAAGAKDFLAEVADMAVGAIFDSEVLDKLPMVSWAVRLWNIKDVYQQRRLKRNCLAFIRAFAQADPQAGEKLRAQLEQNPQAATELADTVADILIESEKPLKASCIARLLVALADEKISIEEFNDLSQIVQAASVPALLAAASFHQRLAGQGFENRMSVPEEPLLLSLGVAYRYGNMFRVTALGQRLGSAVLEAMPFNDLLWTV